LLQHLNLHLQSHKILVQYIYMRNDLNKITKLLRYLSIASTTAAGSGHPSSCLSSVELMTALVFGGHFRFDLDDPEYSNNDRLIFSKGHAAPLFYALFAVAGKVSVDEIKTLRQLNSKLEGHPTLEFGFTEVATGSLGQGLSIGVGMALNAKYLDKLSYKTYILLGDSEMAEGSNWEAMAVASHYKLNNLIGIIDVNRLGQRGETMYGHNVKNYKAKIESFGWKAIVIDGHDIKDISKALAKAATADKPTMLIAKTLKGKGVSFIQDQDNWHGRALSTAEANKAYAEIGEVDLNYTAMVAEPERLDPEVPAMPATVDIAPVDTEEKLSTRQAYGYGLLHLVQTNPNVVVLDAETSNSTYAEMVKKYVPDRFFEMFIAEQNMAGVALGLSRRGKIPFASTFAAFWTRAHDQIRMAQYSGGNIKFVGSHAGVSIGLDGASQMALEDLSLFRSVHGMTVLYPSDAVSTEQLIKLAVEHKGNIFIRTTRAATKYIYDTEAEFYIGGSQVLRSSSTDALTVIAAGITLHEALKAYDELLKEGIKIRVIDLYSLKPLDAAILQQAAAETGKIITVEDHYSEGGLGEAVSSCLAASGVFIYIMAVGKLPHSGEPNELMQMEEINAEAIIKKVKQLIVL